MWYADSIGLTVIRDRMRGLQQEHGEVWQPANLLTRLAEQDQGFRDL